jgi:signal transduction histidine kinase
MSHSVNPLQILIVDDLPTNLAVLSQTLKATGFRVTVATDGEGAIEQAAYSPPALILLDIMLPQIDGFETCRRLKSNPRTAQIPIIFMTALDDSMDKLKGFSLGAVDYITKPFQHEEVLARVQTHLQIKQLSQVLEQQNLELLEEVKARSAAEAALRQTNQELQQEIQERIVAEEALKQYRNDLEALVESRTAQLSQVNHQLQMTLTQLSQQTADLTRSNAELEQMAYIASHDLQEPLRMVASYTQLLARRYSQQLDAKADKYIHYIVDGAERMQTLIGDLLNYSRIDCRGKELHPISCQEMLQQALLNLQMAIEENQAQIDYGDLPEVVADPIQMVQVFQNLIGNAIKYRSEAPPHIKIAVVPLEQTWYFTVRDNGIGIDPNQTDRIFFIFQRLHHREAYSGSGIGLAICKKIIEGHGGTIGVKSTLGEGACFWFTLPRPEGLDQ